MFLDKLSLEEKRSIVEQHYSVAYKIKVDPDLKPEVVLDLYDKIVKLHKSERNHREKKSAQAVLKLIV